MTDATDISLFLAQAGCAYTKAALCPPFHLRQFAEAWLLDGIDLRHCLDEITRHLAQHAARYRSGSGDGTLPFVNSAIRKSWCDMRRPPRAQPATTERLYKRTEAVTPSAKDPLGQLPNSNSNLPAAIPQKSTQTGPRRPIEKAVAFLLNELAHGELPAVFVEEAAKDEGIALRTLDRARLRLRIVSRRSGFGKTGRSWLSLPTTPETA
jgi:hypothetical protein